MAGEIITVDYGPVATGWNTYMVMRNPAGLVGNGTTFVTATDAARNLGAVSGTEQGTMGAFTYTVPAYVTTPADYYMSFFRRLGGSPAVSDGQPLARGYQSLPLPVSGSNVISYYYTYSSVNTVNSEQEGVIYRGQGTPILFTAVPEQVIDGAYWEGRLGTGNPSDSYVSFTVALGNMTVNSATGAITCNPTATQTAALKVNRPARLELWRTGSGDDNKTLVAIVKLTVLDTLRP